MIERRLQTRGELFLREHAVGPHVAARQKIAVLGDVRVERHLVGAVPPAPEAMAVARLVYGDAIDPGSQARLAAEAMDGTEDTEENFLGEIERFVAVAEQVQRELEDHALMLADEIGAGGFVARGAALDEHGLAAADL